MSESLADCLGELAEQLSRLPETEEPPATTLQVIGRGQQERDWQQLLFHYLSSDEPHGLDHALLNHLLTKLTERDDLAFSFSRLALNDVQVECEVVTSNERRPDAVVWAGNDWFICWELKVGAAEADDQTPDYISADSFQGIGLEKDDVPNSGHHYIYLAPRDASPPKANEFVPISWEWIASQIESFLAESYGRYPARTTGQLNEFVDTIRRELTMTEYQENQREKAKLYFQYYDEITEAQDAFESQWDWFANNWGSQLAEVVREAEPVEIPSLRDTDVAIKPTQPAIEDDRWIFRQGDSDWAGIFKNGWWRHKDDLANIYTKAENKNDIRITLFHRLKQNREQAVRDGELELELWHGTGNGDQFMNAFQEEITRGVEESDGEIPASVSVAGSRGNPLTLTYDIPIREQDDFFEAYVEALDEAFYDIVIQNRELSTIITESFENSLELFE